MPVYCSALTEPTITATFGGCMHLDAIAAAFVADNDDHPLLYPGTVPSWL